MGKIILFQFKNKYEDKINLIPKDIEG